MKAQAELRDTEGFVTELSISIKYQKSFMLKKKVGQSSFLSKVFFIFADFVLILAKMTKLLKATVFLK